MAGTWNLTSLAVVAVARADNPDWGMKNHLYHDLQQRYPQS
jgi:hypothetical protein